MSDTLPDLATCLPSDFLNHHHHHHVPSDFASSSSTESESDEDDVTELTRRFTRSVSLQERFITPYPLEKSEFSGSVLNRNVSGPVHARSSPATPFGQRNEDCWDLIYAAAEQVAMMKMKMKMNALNDAVFANRGLLGAPQPVGAPVSHHYFPQRVTGGPVGLRHSAWPPLPAETQRRQQPVHGGFTGVVKKERSGTGVFLPRNYPNIPPELKKKPACLPTTYMPAGVVRSLNKNMDPIIAQPQPQLPPPPPQRNIHGGFAPPYELVMARRNAVMLAQQRRAGVAETREVVLPQEWTY